jgi:hypothetical protein
MLTGSVERCLGVFTILTKIIAGIFCGEIVGSATTSRIFESPALILPFAPEPSGHWVDVGTFGTRSNPSRDVANILAASIKHGIGIFADAL